MILEGHYTTFDLSSDRGIVLERREAPCLMDLSPQKGSHHQGRTRRFLTRPNRIDP